MTRTRRCPSPRETEVVAPGATACCRRIDAYAVGVAAWRLGAGRARREDPVSPAAGVVLLRRPGEAVRAGDRILELHADAARPGSRRRWRWPGQAVTLSDTPPPAADLVLESIR